MASNQTIEVKENMEWTGRKKVGSHSTTVKRIVIPFTKGWFDLKIPINIQYQLLGYKYTFIVRTI